MVFVCFLGVFVVVVVVDVAVVSLLIELVRAYNPCSIFHLHITVNQWGVCLILTF